MTRPQPHIHHTSHSEVAHAIARVAPGRTTESTPQEEYWPSAEAVAKKPQSCPDMGGERIAAAPNLDVTMACEKKVRKEEFRNYGKTDTTTMRHSIRLHLKLIKDKLSLHTA